MIGSNSETLADLLTALRKDAGVSREEIAKVIGMTRCQIWGLETGRSKHPRAETLKKLAAYYGVPVERLVVRLCLT